MALITSSSNPRVSRARELQTPKGRQKHGLFLMEGPHLLEVLLDSDVLPAEVYYQPALLERTAEGRALLRRLLHSRGLSNNDRVEVSERVIESISETQTSQGVVSVLPLSAFLPRQTQARRPPGTRPALLILDGLSDPGNMGTILRTALAADVEEVLLTPDCVDCFGPKVVRAAAGAHVALPVAVDQSWEAIEEHIEKHCRGQRRVLLAEAGSSHPYFEHDLRTPFALITGNEAHGASAEARRRSPATISIPLANNVESLNAAIATAIILYEAVRQKQTGTR
jgi:RNA methyltransferase, TrmH family